MWPGAKSVMVTTRLRPPHRLIFRCRESAAFSGRRTMRRESALESKMG